MKKYFLMLAAALPLALASCGDDDPVSAISISGDSAVDYAKTIELKSDVKGVEWSSSNEFVATVDKNGKVTGVHAGTCTIKATKDGVSSTHNVTVNATNNNFELPVLEWGISKSQLNKLIPSTYTLIRDNGSACVYSANGENYPWYSYVLGDDNALKGSMLVITTEQDEDLDMEGFLDQRYKYYGEDENVLQYIDAETMAEANLGVMYTYDADLDGVTVTFMPVSHTKSVPFDMSVREEAIKAVKSARK